MEYGGHADRVAWYQALIEEWTGKVPQCTRVGEVVVAWVEPYCSVEEIWHMQTEVCAGSVESALERLANAVFAMVSLDRSPVLMGG